MKVHDPEGNIDLIIAKERLAEVGKDKQLEVIESMTGRDLVGRKYEPLFPYFAELADEGAFQILSDDYVSTDSGTGIVHQAPAFGEDDFRVLNCTRYQRNSLPCRHVW